MFALLGAHGQAMFVDPASRLVMEHTAVIKYPNDRNLETRALWQALVDGSGAERTAEAHRLSGAARHANRPARSVRAADMSQRRLR